MGVYLYQNNSELAMKNAYIGEYRVPGANTIAYYPLNSDLNDASGNSRNLTASGITISSKDGVDCALVSGFGYNSSWGGTLSQITLNCWFNMNVKSEHYCLIMGLKSGANSSDTNNTFILGDFDGRPANGFGLQYSQSSGGYQYGVGSGTPGSRGVWYNGCITWDGSNIKIYTNGELKTTYAWSTQLARDAIILGWNANNSNVYVSNAIYEDKARTAQEIANYYNQTKSNYGL